MKASSSQNQKLKKQLQEFENDASNRDSEKGEIKKKIGSLLHLLDTLDQDGQNG